MDGEAGNGRVSSRAQALRRYLPALPILAWAGSYDRDTLVSDLLAALIVTIMLIPQGLAYALLAGLPPEAGLYASIAPLLLYALFGTSRVLAVGPVAGISLVTNPAAGISPTPLNHAEVVEVGAQASRAFSGLVERWVGLL